MPRTCLCPARTVLASLPCTPVKTHRAFLHCQLPLLAQAEKHCMQFISESELEHACKLAQCFKRLALLRRESMLQAQQGFFFVMNQWFKRIVAPWFRAPKQPGSALVQPGSAWFRAHRAHVVCQESIRFPRRARSHAPGSGATDIPFYNIN